MTDDLPFGVFLRNGEAVFSWQLALELATERPIRILGIACSSHGCATLAQFRTYWPAPSGDRYELGQAKCAACAEILDRTARAMGFGLPVKPIHIERDVEIMMLSDYRRALAQEAERLRATHHLDDAALRFAAMELD